MAALGGLERQPRGFGVALIALSLVPAAWITYAVIGDLFYGTRHLGTDPVKLAEHLFGSWTLRFLLATLAVTPLRRMTGWNWLAKHRRTLGWDDIATDIFKRPFITIGMLGFVLMVPLAVTSTKKMIARLGKNWRKLHRLIYLIAVLGVIHFWMAVKLDIREPAIYGLILALLLGWRWRDARRSAAIREAATP
jgi:sulfoxide reductase heme-binding subunit YedZ